MAGRGMDGQGMERQGQARTWMGTALRVKARSGKDLMIYRGVACSGEAMHVGPMLGCARKCEARIS